MRTCSHGLHYLWRLSLPFRYRRPGVHGPVLVIVINQFRPSFHPFLLSLSRFFSPFRIPRPFSLFCAACARIIGAGRRRCVACSSIGVSCYSSAACGAPLCNWAFTTLSMLRRPGDVGLVLTRAITPLLQQTGYRPRPSGTHRPS